MAIVIDEAIASHAYGSEPAMPGLEITVTRGPRRLRLLSLGAAIRSFEIPDANAVVGNVHLQLPNASDYADMSLNPHLGATVGRYANRLGNAQFTLSSGDFNEGEPGGTVFHTDANRPPHTLHGGTWGFDRLVWKVVEAASTVGANDRVTFRLDSKNGDMGFPGNLVAEATYELSDNALAFHYRATTDAPTIISLTNHGYWNLSGEERIANHTLTVASDRVLTIGSDIVPTGGFTDIANTPLDLRTPVRLGEALGALPSGFDHCYVVRGATLDAHAPVGDLRVAAVLAGGSRWMSVTTDCPGLQVYTGNALRPPFVPHGSVSLETQRLPDAPNHANFGPYLLLPGDEYRSSTVLTFGVGTPPTLV